jgi:hypothetical protein
MAAAAGLPCEAIRPSFAKPRARQQLHAYLDGWVARLEAHRPDDTPSLEALTQAVLTRRQELTGRSTQALVAQQHARVLHQRTMRGPPCQGLLAARPAPPRTVYTMGGEVPLSRPSFDGMPGQQGFAPLDDVLQLSERRTPWDLQKAGARLAAEVPWKTAQELCRDLPGLSLSAPTLHDGTGELRHALGVLEVSPTAAEMARPWRSWRRARGGGRSGCWRSMAPLSPRVRSPPKARPLAAGEPVRTGPGGRGKGRRPWGVAAP